MNDCIRSTRRRLNAVAVLQAVVLVGACSHARLVNAAQLAAGSIALTLVVHQTAHAQCWFGQFGQARNTPPHTREALMIRGREQWLHLYGTRGNPPIVVSSGDGGWIHLGPHVADALATHGFFVIGFDVKAYLEGFTSGQATLRAEDEPGDYKVLADYAARRSRSTRKPILIGVSEGAGLSVLAATDPQTRASIAGVIGLGLPDLNELGWRWRDSLIYLTHGTPNEPTFSAATMVKRLDSTPLGCIHSTRDEFVALSEVRKILDGAREPKRLWIVPAADHRFSDNLPELDRRLLEAITWVEQNAPQNAPQRAPR